MKKRKVFVTGLTGLVGSGFLYHLVKNNCEFSCLVALCRDSSNTSLVEKYCTIEKGSSFDKQCLDTIFQKYDFDTIIHISNKEQIVQFAELAVKYNVKKYIAISSTYACSETNPHNHMIMLENNAKKLLQDNKIEYIFLRPTSIFGTRPDKKSDRNISIFTKYVKRLRYFPIFQRGKASTKPVWGRDVGLALFILLRYFDDFKDGEYIVSGDKKRTFKELIELIYDLNNKKPHFLFLPKWFGIFIFYLLYYLSFSFIDKRESIHRLMENKAFDTSFKLIEYGYSPTPFEIAYKVLDVYQ